MDKLLDQQQRLLALIGANLAKFEDPSMTLEGRQALIAEQKRIEAELRDTGEAIDALRKEIIATDLIQHRLNAQAKTEASSLSNLRKNLVRSVIFLLVVVIALFLVRTLAIRRVADPQRRHFLNRGLSVFTVFVVIIGLLVIFVRDVSHLVTGMGVAVAGLAIALQEIVASFCAWFVIRGSKGYRIGDWIRIGEHYGEVVDIGLLMTMLSQVTPLTPSGESGGAWTGGLIGLANSTVFKEPFINYTKGYPYIWCTLDYTFTYESDWKAAERLILEAVDDEEIKGTARKARKRMEQIAAAFVIKIDNTEAKVRTRTADSGVEPRLRFLAHPRRRRRLMDKINRRIMESVRLAEKIEFAYQTFRVVSDSAK